MFLERQVSDHADYILFTEQAKGSHLFPKKLLSTAESKELWDL